jgi:DHA2 family methylenomycin A resistance protein-like MFS transporter
MATASLQTTALESVAPSRAGIAAGLYSTLRYAGSFVGTAVLSVLLGGGDRYGAVFAMALGAAAASALVATRIPGRPALLHPGGLPAGPRLADAERTS